MFTFFLFLFIVISSIKFTLNFRPLYYFDINYLNIDKYTTLNKNEIKSTYDYLINYMSISKTNEFNIPLLKSSMGGKIHFSEVKKLFSKLDLILFTSTVVSIFSIFFINKCKNFSFLKWTSNLLLCICLLMWIPFYINFNKSFDTFHKIFFKNGYWLFDPQNDPVITILPEKFFFHCALLIIILIIILSIMLKIVYIKLNSNKNSK